MASTVDGTVLDIQIKTNATQVYSQVDKAAKATSLTAERLVRKLKEQEVALTQGKRAADLYAASMSNATPDQIAAINASHDRIEAERALQEEMRRAADAEKLKAAATQKGRSAVEQMVKSLQEQNMVLRRGSDHLERYRALKAGATREELKAMKALQMHNKELMKTDKGFQFATRKGRQFNAMFGQLGYQIQDITVQMQMNTNAGIIMAQQGSQILSIFGHWGAIAGAVAAIGGAMYTAASATTMARESMEELSTSLETIKSKYEDASGAARDLARVELVGKMDDLRKKVADSKAELELFNIQLASAARQGNEQEVEKIAEQYRLLSIRTIAASERLQELEDVLKKPEGYSEQQKALQRSQEEIANTIDKLWEEAETYGMSEAQILAYTMRKQGATDAQIEEALALHNTVAELEREAEAREKAAEALKKEQEEKDKAAAKLAQNQIKEQTDTGFEKEAAVFDKLAALEDEFRTEQELLKQHEAEKLRIIEEANALRLITDQEATELRAQIEKQASDAQKAILEQNAMQAAQSATQSLDALAKVFGEGSAMAKAAFVANQGIAIAQAIMSAEVASARALESLPPPFNIPMAATIKGLGYAAAGAIAGQTIASFDGGGIVGGVRAGGMDGVGGRLAVVHPDEKIGLPDQVQGGGEVSVSFNINAVDTEGFDKLLATRQGMIVNMINRAVNNSGRRSIV